jgi:hypothetical protein
MNKATKTLIPTFKDPLIMAMYDIPKKFQKRALIDLLTFFSKTEAADMIKNTGQPSDKIILPPQKQVQLLLKKENGINIAINKMIKLNTPLKKRKL